LINITPQEKYNSKKGKQMPKRVQPLSDKQVRDASPKSKNYKLSDGHGLYLLVTTQGGKLWRFDYPFAGKRKAISFGSYPNVALEQARVMSENARTLIVAGVDPSKEKQRQAAIEKAERLSLFANLSLTIHSDETVELWKGKAFFRLSKDEAVFVAEQVSKLFCERR